MQKLKLNPPIVSAVVLVFQLVGWQAVGTCMLAMAAETAGSQSLGYGYVLNGFEALLVFQSKTLEH